MLRFAAKLSSNPAVWIVAGALLLTLAAPVVLHAGDETGGQPSAYLEWGVGARPVAMGGAFTAIADGPTGFWWNPAGLSQERQDGIEVALRKMTFDRQAGYIALVHPIGREEAAIAVSWVYAGVGDLFEIDLGGNRGAAISDFANAASFSFARRFTDQLSPLALSVGLSIRYAQHNIAGINAYSVGIDLGTQVRYRLRHQSIVEGDVPPELLFGVSVQRLNQKYPWTTSDYWIPKGEDGGSSFEERFPILVRTGAATRFLNGRALLSFDVVSDGEQGISWHVGAEGTLRKTLALRAGLDGGDLTFGAGVRPKLRSGLLLSLDYAYAVQPDAIDADHIFSLGVRF